MDISYGIGLEELDAGEDPSGDKVVVFEVAQAQSQSVEVKKGFLVDWRVQRTPPSCIPGAGITLAGSSSLLFATTVPLAVVTPPPLQPLVSAAWFPWTCHL